jgi:hypothetical protein
MNNAHTPMRRIMTIASGKAKIVSAMQKNSREIEIISREIIFISREIFFISCVFSPPRAR